MNSSLGKMLLITDVCEFSSGPKDSNLLFVEHPEHGNFIWNNKKNEIKYFDGQLIHFLDQTGQPFVRSWGRKLISEYCGPRVKIINKK